MVYEYENDKGQVIEREFSMTGDIPGSIIDNGTVYTRRWNLGSGGIHIPKDFGSTDNPLRFDKSPSKRKHYY